MTEELSPLRKGDLKAGESLMADFKGKTYPVIFEALAGENRFNCMYMWPYFRSISLHTVTIFLGLVWSLVSST